jgi:hypothetical protein
MIAAFFKKKGKVICLFLMGIYFLAACGTSPNLLPVLPVLAAPRQAISSPTPFQPQAIDTVQVLSTGIPPLLEPTFTPYPTRYVISENLPTPIQVLPTPSAVSPPLDIYDPLTGMPVADPSLLNRRPMAIKVANSPDYIRPQSGLTLADVVYEYYIEWGDTRFIAVMYGNDSPMVGPVRSGRYFDEHIARMYNAFLVFKYADPREYNYLKDSTLKDFLVVPGNHICPPFAFGPQKRESYNNFFFNTLKWAACAADKGLDNTKPTFHGGFFSDKPPESELHVTRIYTRYTNYSYNYWDYDPITHKYFRYQEANDMVKGQPEAYTPLTDAQTGQPVTADNVVELFVPYVFANPNEAHDEVYHIDLIDSGNAYVFRDGAAIPAHWNRVEVNQPILLTNLDGTPIYMHPGRTFYQVIGTTSSYTQSGTDWKFYFATP